MLKCHPPRVTDQKAQTICVKSRIWLITSFMTLLVSAILESQSPTKSVTMKELRCRAIFQELGTIPQVRAQAGFKRPVQRRANLKVHSVPSGHRKSSTCSPNPQASTGVFPILLLYAVPKNVRPITSFVIGVVHSRTWVPFLDCLVGKPTVELVELGLVLFPKSSRNELWA